MKKQMIISVMSKDRPGIIASITGAIYRLGGDVADLNQTVLCGYLTMILSASFDPEVTKEDLLAAISHIKTECKFEVSIKELAEASADIDSKPPDETYILTVQGPNKAGIVHGITQFCYEHNINILDLATTLKNSQYTMALQLDLRKCSVNLETLQKGLDDYARQSDLTVMIQHNDIFQVTHEVSLH
jgi:glycine cleavage system transcriptional repressor